MAKNSGRSRRAGTAPRQLEKCPTGIRGLDEITGGGLPKGRPTLVCGNAGCGKTIIGMEFLVHGAVEFGEPGVFVSFEETPQELEANVSSLGFNLRELGRRKQIAIEHVHIERSEIEETGEYDLDGLFIRLAYAIDSVGAKRVVLDTIEVLFATFQNMQILRSELRRLFRWLKDKGVTAVITCERGEGALTRHGLEEYVADCVILLDLRVREQIATRRLRVVKYRGTTHGTDEYPFLIDERGISILPVTSLGLDHTVSDERVPTGIPRLDTMLGGQGYFRGSSVLMSGTPGSGKSSIAAKFVESACRRGERCLYFSFEESSAQIIRNMQSIGCRLKPWVDRGILRFHTSRPAMQGLEMHLVTMHKLISEFRPAIVVVDPISNIASGVSGNEAKSMLTRLIDFLKMQQITALLTDLTKAGTTVESSSEELSSLIDTWICLRDMEYRGERNRALHVLKSRGMAHSNQIREFVMSSNGVDLVDVYLGAGGVLTGTARIEQEAAEAASVVARQQETDKQKRLYQRKQALLEVNVKALRMAFEGETADTKERLEKERKLDQMGAADRAALGRRRGNDATSPRRKAAGAPSWSRR